MVWTGNKEDQARDGKTTSTPAYNQTDPGDNDLTSDMTWLTTAEDSLKWDAVESDFISSRLKQPARPATLITTTTTTQPIKHDQASGTTKAHDQHEEDTRDDDGQDNDTLLTLSQFIDSRNSARPKQPHQAHLYKKATTRSSHVLLPAKMHVQFISSAKRSERNTLLNVFALSELPSPTRQGLRPKHSGSQGKSALCVQGVD